jgi:hypothetical protein
LDVTFKEDQSRLRRGHGATNMALIRHLALNVIRSMPGKTTMSDIWASLVINRKQTRVVISLKGLLRVGAFV